MPTWRSWIAALCVALIAFATLEAVSPAHAADPCEQGVTLHADNAAPASVTSDSGQDENGAPGDQQKRHHCCGAHTSSAPPLAHTGMPLQFAEVLAPTHANDAALDRAPTGLERPPKAAAIV